MSAPVLDVHAALASVTRAVSHLPKQSSRGVSYEFRSIDALLNVLHRPMADAGLTMSLEVGDDWSLEHADVVKADGKTATVARCAFRLSVVFHAEDGTSVRFGPGLAQSTDYGDKAVYQAQQNALKYLLLSAFSIPVDEPDMDGRPAADIAALSKQWSDLLASKPALSEAFAEKAGGQTFESLNRESQQGWIRWGASQ